MDTDFYQPWNVIVEKYPDKIVMVNPGIIICGKKQMLKGGISQPRNKGLFKTFKLIGLGEHAGSGVPDIFKGWKNEGLEKPEVDEQFGGRENGHPDRTILTLPLVAENIILVTNLVTSGQDSDQDNNDIEKLLTFCRGSTFKI